MFEIRSNLHNIETIASVYDISIEKAMQFIAIFYWSVFEKGFLQKILQIGACRLRE